MTAIIFGTLLIFLALVSLALQRLYSSIPIHELKRLSRRGDPLAVSLYRPAAYGASLRIFLWVIIILALAGGLLLLVPQLPGVIDFIVAAGILAVALVLLPSLRLTVHTAQFAAWFSSALVAPLRYVHPLFAQADRLVGRVRELSLHSRLYEKEDLRNLLHQQKEQPDNRISLEELELTHRALGFSDKQAADIALPRQKAQVVSADDTIGPVLLDQLHKSGQNSFLVYKDDPETIMGSMLMRDAVKAKHGGRVFDLIRSDLCYVHEDFSLRHVLDAFQKTGHHTAIVINGFGEFVGMITLDAVLAELLGDTFESNDNYESAASIAAYKPPKDSSGQPEPESAKEPAEALQASPEATGVVE
jgi:CBS domain containing-hemolysin-like protein